MVHPLVARCSDHSLIGQDGRAEEWSRRMPGQCHAAMGPEVGWDVSVSVGTWSVEDGEDGRV